MTVKVSISTHDKNAKARPYTPYVIQDIATGEQRVAVTTVRTCTDNIVMIFGDKGIIMSTVKDVWDNNRVRLLRQDESFTVTGQGDQNDPA